MIRKNKKILILFTVVCLPLVIISSPEWFKINGISPCWPVIFLLPFSLNNNPFRSAFFSILLGIFIDSFTLSDASYIPSLLIFSLVCSQYGLNKNSLAKIGDVVTTSSASTLLPPNLMIGIVQFVDEKALPSPFAIVQLTASPEAIDWVQVLTNND